MPLGGLALVLEPGWICLFVFNLYHHEKWPVTVVGSKLEKLQYEKEKKLRISEIGVREDFYCKECFPF